MQNKFFNRFLLLFNFLNFKEVESKEDAFKNLKGLLLSVKNREDLIDVVKLINHFNQTHGIEENSPEFIYFSKMVKLMRIVIRRKALKSGEENDESQRKCEIELEEY